jgi:hypothetical protein
MSQALDLAVMAWSPLGMGVLTGKYGDGRHPRAIRGCTSTPAVGACSPRATWRSRARSAGSPTLRDNLGALGVALGADHLARLDEVSRVDLGFPSEFISAQLAGAFVLGETGGRIDDHRALRSGLPLSRHASVTDPAQ